MGRNFFNRSSLIKIILSLFSLMEEVSATVEESTSAEEVAALAGNLLGVAETMEKAVATFKV